jgi:hypothetical protein
MAHKLGKDDVERFARIKREAMCGYGITLKDLAWLVRLTAKLLEAETKRLSC